MRAYVKHLECRPIDATVGGRGRFAYRPLCKDDYQVTVEIVRNHQPHEPPNVGATH